MSSSKKIVKNLLSLSVAEAANKGIMFLVTMILGRVILKEGMGVIGTGQSFYVYCLLLVNLGFNIVGAREVAKFPGRIKEYVNAIITVRLLLSIVVYAALAILVYSIDKPEIEKTAIMIYGLNMFFNAILVDWVYQGTERMEVLAIRQLITSILNLIGVYILVNEPNDSVLAVAVMVTSFALNSLWMFMYYLKSYGSVKPSFDIPLLKDLLKSSLPLTFYGFFVIMLNNLNIMMLTFMDTQAETGLFYTATRVLIVAIVPTAVIQFAFLPLLSRAKSTDDKRKIMTKYSQLIIMTAVISTGVIFTFSDYMITFIAGPDFSEAGSLLKILMVSAFIVFINTMYSTPLIAWKVEKVLVWVMGGAAIVNAIANTVLIPAYGAEGASVGTVIGELAVCIGVAYHFKKRIDKLYLMQLFKYLPIAAAACLSGYYLNQTGLHTIPAIFASIIIYIGINFLFKTITIEELKGYIK